MKTSKFIELQNLVDRGEDKTLEERLRKENIRFDSEGNVSAGKFLSASVFCIKGENKEEKQIKIINVLEKYGAVILYRNPEKLNKDIYDSGLKNINPEYKN
ncbi:MAG: hypothetical protein Q8O84_03185 [Nanoarchaeota archaeon]|nr:hypothetical protein [Nanoarchaeota archaeon]